ncbi:HNH endonuclease [Granulosicoccus sp.]|nr:HNH endonuclease [Granulosicoccus sp.]
MDDSSVSTVQQKTQSIPLGMSSFDKNEQHNFGENIRLAMACMEGSAEPSNIKAIPSNATDILKRLKVLSQDVTSSCADLVELLLRFDELEGWKSSGASHCAQWMNREMGISRQLGWEYLRVGRLLRSLPTTTALFRAGKISWSKVRLIVYVANKDNEKILCHAALDGSVSEVKRLCDGYRWKKDDEVEGDANARAVKQWQSRSLTWQETPIGSTRIQLTLPPDRAQAFLNSVERSLKQLDNRDDADCDNGDARNSKDSKDSKESDISQRRADAAVLMAENSLQQGGREIATADRYQVIMSVDATDLISSTNTAELNPSANSTETSSLTHNHKTPSKRPTIKGVGPIARETALRIACDCSLSTHIISNGEPLDIGRKGRIWTNGQSRGIKERDQHCRFPGCTRAHNLENHHVIHWANGGHTRVSNGVALCPYHHSLVHEGGYTIERVSDSEQRMDEQFEQQRHAEDVSLFDFERELRNNRESFDTVRKLSPTRFSYRVLNAQGVDVRTLSDATVGISLIDNNLRHPDFHDSGSGDPSSHDSRLHDQGSCNPCSCDTDSRDTNSRDAGDAPKSYRPRHSTRVDCSEPDPEIYDCISVDDRSVCFTKPLVTKCSRSMPGVGHRMN